MAKKKKKNGKKKKKKISCTTDNLTRCFMATGLNFPYTKGMVG